MVVGVANVVIGDRLIPRSDNAASSPSVAPLKTRDSPASQTKCSWIIHRLTTLLLIIIIIVVIVMYSSERDSNVHKHLEMCSVFLKRYFTYVICVTCLDAF